MLYQFDTNSFAVSTQTILDFHTRTNHHSFWRCASTRYPCTFTIENECEEKEFTSSPYGICKFFLPNLLNQNHRTLDFNWHIISGTSVLIRFSWVTYWKAIDWTDWLIRNQSGFWCFLVECNARLTMPNHGMHINVRMNMNYTNIMCIEHNKLRWLIGIRDNKW